MDKDDGKHSKSTKHIGHVYSLMPHRRTIGFHLLNLCSVFGVALSGKINKTTFICKIIRLSENLHVWTKMTTFVQTTEIIIY